MAGGSGFEGAEEIDEGARAGVALARLEAEVAIAVANDAPGFPVALGAGRFDSELPIFAEIIECDEVRHDFVAVREKRISGGDPGFIGYSEKQSACGNSIGVGGERAPGSINEEIKREAQKDRVPEFPSKPQEENVETNDAFNEAGKIGDQFPAGESLREW